MAIFTVLFSGDSDKTVSVLYGAKSSSMYFGAAAKVTLIFVGFNLINNGVLMSKSDESRFFLVSGWQTN